MIDLFMMFGFSDEMKKEAVTVSELAAITKRIPHATMRSGAGRNRLAFTVPKMKVLHGTVGAVAERQQRVMQSGADPYLTRLMRRPGRIHMAQEKDMQHAGRVLSGKKFSKQQGKGLKGFFLRHEADELAQPALTGRALTHANEIPLIHDANTRYNLKGHGAGRVGTAIDTLRGTEFSHLKVMANKAFKDPRAGTEFVGPGKKMNRSARKAFMRLRGQSPMMSDQMTTYQTRRQQGSVLDAVQVARQSVERSELAKKLRYGKKTHK